MRGARLDRRRRPLNFGIRLQTSSNGVATAKLCDAAATLPEKSASFAFRTPPCALIHDGRSLPAKHGTSQRCGPNSARKVPKEEFAGALEWFVAPAPDPSREDVSAALRFS